MKICGKRLVPVAEHKRLVRETLAKAGIGDLPEPLPPAQSAADCAKRRPGRPRLSDAARAKGVVRHA